MKQLPVIKNKLVKLPPFSPENTPQDAQYRVISEEDEAPKPREQTKIVFNKVLASRDMGMLAVGFILGMMLMGSCYLEHKESHNCQAIHGKK